MSNLTTNHALAANDWRDLVYLAHTDKSQAFDKYARHYLSTDGQLYESDNFQLAAYIDGYHEQLDQRMCDRVGGTEMITELYVPRNSLRSFLSDAGELLRQENASVIYGTVRIIERDEETFLPWAEMGLHSTKFACKSSAARHSRICKNFLQPH